MSSNIIIDNSQMIKSMHNDIQCLSLESATRPCDRCWFTSKQIQEWSGMDRKTLDRRLEKLASVGRIFNNIETFENTENNENSMRVKFDPHQSDDQKPSDVMSITLFGANNIPHETKIYNLNVLNHLAMVELDNEKLNSIANKFSDILSEVETTGSYGLQLDEHDRLLLNAVKAKTDVERVAAINALDDYNNRQLAVVTQERDIAVKTKAQISTKREASLMGKTGALTKENTRLKGELETANNSVKQLTAEREIALLGLYNSKEVSVSLKAKYPFIKYAEKTLRTKVSKALKTISLALGEPIRDQPNPKDPSYSPTPYFTKRTVDQLFECIERDSNYLKSFK